MLHCTDFDGICCVTYHYKGSTIVVMDNDCKEFARVCCFKVAQAELRKDQKDTDGKN